MQSETTVRKFLEIPRKLLLVYDWRCHRRNGKKRKRWKTKKPKTIEKKVFFLSNFILFYILFLLEKCFFNDWKWWHHFPKPKATRRKLVLSQYFHQVFPRFFFFSSSSSSSSSLDFPIYCRCPKNNRCFPFRVAVIGLHLIVDSFGRKLGKLLSFSIEMLLVFFFWFFAFAFLLYWRWSLEIFCDFPPKHFPLNDLFVTVEWNQWTFF